MTPVPRHTARKPQNPIFSLWGSCALQEPAESMVQGGNGLLGGVARAAGHYFIFWSLFPSWVPSPHYHQLAHTTVT